jgi:protein-tyrosine phosphatase
VYDAPNENLMPHWPKAIEFIRDGINKGGNVLVHCYAGISRSSSTVIAYLMVEKKVTFYNAATYVRKKRAIIYPNIGFQRQLIKLEKVLQKSSEMDDKSSVVSKPKKLVRKSHSQARSETR